MKTNMADMINSLADNYMNNQDKGIEPTIAGQIRAKLNEFSIKKDKKAYVENENDPVATYHLGTESAKIYKRLDNGTVGEDNGTIRYYAEYSDIKRLDWWKTVLDTLQISFLETPIDDFARQAQMSSPELVFTPEAVIKHYHLNSKEDEETQIAAKQWVQDQVINILTPLLAPDYKLQFFEEHFRLIPLTHNAIESREIDNQTYENAKRAIVDSVTLLQDSYQKMSEELDK
jgi:hypothetical protein